MNSTHKNRLKINIIANIAGSVWSALIQLAFIPLYISLLGIESFGLIGFYLTMQVVLQILDFGLSPTINREMARYSVLPDKFQESRNLVRTLEICYWGISAAIGIAVIALAHAIASHWIHAGELPMETVRTSVILMGILAAIQWPLTFYQGGLMGLQRQTLVSGLDIFTATLTHGGAVVVLIFVSPTITAFFMWRILVGVLQVGLNMFFLWRSLPASHLPARFDIQQIRNVWRFSAGMGGITLSAIILSQTDKIVLSKVLTLEYFGYYSLACTVVNGLSKLSIPVFNAIYPRFTSMLAAGDEDGLRRTYHVSTQFMVAIIFPVATLIMFFSNEIMVLWTRNIGTADHTSQLISIMIMGTAINGLMYLPYTLQIAAGWTKIGLAINIVFLIVLVPSMIVMSMAYGGIGAAIVWVVLNVLYMAVGVPLTHRRLLRGQAFAWFTEDVGPPVLALFVVIWIGRQAASAPMSPFMTVLVLFGILSAALAASVLSSNRLRSVVVDVSGKFFRLNNG